MTPPPPSAPSGRPRPGGADRTGPAASVAPSPPGGPGAASSSIASNVAHSRSRSASNQACARPRSARCATAGKFCDAASVIGGLFRSRDQGSPCRAAGAGGRVAGANSHPYNAASGNFGCATWQKIGQAAGFVRGRHARCPAENREEGKNVRLRRDDRPWPCRRCHQARFPETRHRRRGGDRRGGLRLDLDRTR